MMLARVHEFFALLRKNGVAVSTAEVLDGLRALDLVGFGDPETVRAALGAAVLKRGRDREVFDEIFDLFFLRRGEFALRAGEAPLLEALAAAGFSADEIETIVAMLQDEAARLSSTARMGLGLSPRRIEALLRLQGVNFDFTRMSNPLQIGFFAQQLASQMGFKEAEGEVAELRRKLEAKLGDERGAALAEVLSRSLGEMRALVRRFVAEEFDRQSARWRPRARAEMLAEKSFGSMSDAELRALEKEVATLGRKLRDKARQRPTRRRLGRLDARRTLRRSLRSGGVPFTLVRRRKKKELPRLVVLCDISDSVRQVSRFMLQFAYTLQDQFSAVRSFVFVSDIAEVTDLFREHELHRAVELAYSGAAVNVFANSNYGRALSSFLARSADAVTARTTVLVIGDGRNNYHAAEAWALADIRARARRVVWLNPEPPPSWAFGDSAMREYAPHCDRVAVVHNLQSLAKVVDEIVF